MLRSSNKQGRVLDETLLHVDSGFSGGPLQGCHEDFLVTGFYKIVIRYAAGAT